MGKDKREYRTIDEYLESFPSSTRSKLKQLRSLIKRIAPEAQEKISYQMPTFHLNGNLVYFAAYSNHIGFYPTVSGHSKGTVQFPLDEALPMGIIERIVKFRVKENSKKK